MHEAANCWRWLNKPFMEQDRSRIPAVLNPAAIDGRTRPRGLPKPA